MQREEAIDLIRRYNAGTCSEDEKRLLLSWYLQFEQENLPNISDAERQADLEKIWDTLPVRQKEIRKLSLWYRAAAAAIILAFISISIYLVVRPGDDRSQQTALQKSSAITPGTGSTVLTLGGGEQIMLKSAKNGKLTTQGNFTITKTAEGHLAYEANQKTQGTSENLAFNSVTTPTGVTFELMLSDGTKVLLDAASSIHYPVAFNGNERRVEITGQAYFEVAHNKLKPFKVVSNGQTVEVLGTHFNINAYQDEGITKTTLLEGSVKISKGGKVAWLEPGQQSATANADDKITVNNADLETAIAWKMGVFQFKRADLQTVMHQLAHWYNIQVLYESTIPKVAITGKVPRNANASHVLEILNKLGIKFRVDDRKITILPN